MVRGPRRYVLFFAGEPLSGSDAKRLGEALTDRYGQVKVIPVEGDGRAVIIKASEPVARALRGEDRISAPGGVELRPALTSGAIGNLKRRARGAAVDGKIHER